MRCLPVLAATATFLALAGVADAHPKLVSASPGPNSVVASPARVELHFSEKLMPAFSKADLMMAATPGMAAMKLPSSAALAPDGHTLILTPKAQLRPGRYSVAWQVVSTDTHRVAGSYAFAVK